MGVPTAPPARQLPPWFPATGLRSRSGRQQEATIGCRKGTRALATRQLSVWPDAFPSFPLSKRLQRAIFRPLKKAHRFTAGAGAEAALGPPVRNVDDVHGAVALAGNEQFVAAERHVHWLRADLDRGL